MADISDSLRPFLDQAFRLFLRRNKRLTPNQYQLLTEAKTLARDTGQRKILKRLDSKVTKQYLDAKKPIARFEIPRRIRPRQFQTLPTVKLGVYHTDHSTFFPQWAEHNDGNTGFIVYVENFTNRLFAYPCLSTNKESWSRAMRHFFSEVDNVNTVYSDADAVPVSEQWRKSVEQRYGIRWHFLRRMPKAFLAERYVGYIKRQLSISMAMESVRKNQQVMRWVDMLKPLWKNYNRQKIMHTNFERDKVTPQKFEKFLAELKKDKEPEMGFHFYKAGPFSIESWNRRLFKFNLGQKVYVLRKSDPSVDITYRFFSKATRHGSWDINKVFTVSGRQLRSTKNNDLIPVYSLKEFDKKHREDNHISQHFYFYENELKAVPNQNL